MIVTQKLECICWCFLEIALMGFQHLNSSHVELLKHMREQGRQALAKLYADPPNVQVGFHAVPSMRQLHLHIISTDFDSPCMKTKLHYNSFVTSFFIPVEEFIEKLDRPGGAIHIDREEYEALIKTTPLKCRCCGEVFKQMPALKLHLSKAPQVNTMLAPSNQ
ncbi:hypothetical protein BASA60_004684 [Batrachochytrium salamandrivorans]|nr:hypothetical protein BASA60_004684 [Batrachochytrium salamandrivorans]